MICLLKTSTFLFIQDKLIFPSYDALHFISWENLETYTYVYNKVQSVKMIY